MGSVFATEGCGCRGQHLHKNKIQSKQQVVWCSWIYKAALAEWHLITQLDQAEARSLEVTDVKPSHME